MNLDPLAEELARFIRWVMRDVTYSKFYPCEVQRQDAEGLVDLLPDDESIRGSGLAGIQLRHGLPGWTVQVATGARVLLGFDNGDPRKPYAALWEPGSVLGISFDGGSRPVTHLGALVTCGGPGTVVTLLPLTGVGAPPNNAVVAGVPHLISFSVVPPTPASADPLFGSVSSGVDKFTI
ncbi:MAG: hypothetical protein H0U56_15670 [Methylibium sp.]|nr:hypothetical protein [Methylibium sp.]